MADKVWMACLRWQGPNVGIIASREQPLNFKGGSTAF